MAASTSTNLEPRRVPHLIARAPQFMVSAAQAGETMAVDVDRVLEVRGGEPRSTACKGFVQTLRGHRATQVEALEFIASHAA